MKNYKKLKKAFGLNEYYLVDFPKKISNITISRIVNHEKMGGCSYCFPHGFETTNATVDKNTRSWKNARLKQWK